MLCRAVVISILCHLMLLALFVEQWSLRPLGTGAAPLIATLQSARKISPQVRASPATQAVNASSAKSKNPGRLVRQLEKSKARGAGRPEMQRYSSGRGFVDGGEAALSHADSSTPALDADTVRHLRLSLAREARRLRPVEDLAWDGVVVLELVAGPGGGAPVVSLSQSSGIRELDTAARKLLLQVLDSVALPRQMFRLTIPIHYSKGE